MRRVLGLVVCAVVFAACSAKKEESQAAAAPNPDALTRRQKDSILAKSGIPLTGAVGKAMGAADAASAQASAHDSVLMNMK